MAGLDTDTALLLHCDGADTSTTIPDSSITNDKGNATVNNTAELDTAQQKWGSASLLVDGNSDWINYATDADWNVLTNTNYTIDFQIRFTDHTGLEGIIQQVEDKDNKWILYHFDGNGFYFTARSLAADIVSIQPGGEITDSDWHHVAMCKVGNLYGMYVGGIQVSHLSEATTDTYSGPWEAGRVTDGGGGQNYFDGHLDEVRMQKSNYFGALPQTTTFNGDTNSNTTIDNIGDTSPLNAGVNISGTHIPANTRIVSVDSGTAITIDKAATGTQASVVITYPSDTITIPTEEYSEASGPANMASISSVLSANVGKVNSVAIGDIAKINSVD